MSPDELINSALRNQARRAAQLERLNASRKPQARAAIDAGRANSERIHRTREHFSVAQQNRHVPGFFPTPPAVIEIMLQHVCFPEQARVLEPSAGRGDLVTAAQQAGAAQVDCFEINANLREYLQANGFNLVGNDFMQAQPRPIYDVVLMNPPFEHRQDVAHVRRAFEWLAPSGQLVAVVSNPSGDRLREFAEAHRGYVMDLPRGSFLASHHATGVNTALVVINR